MEYFHNIFSKFQLCYLHPLLKYLVSCINKQTCNVPVPLKQQQPLCFKDKARDDRDADIKLSKGEINMVLGRLGLVASDNCESDEERFGSKEISELFEEKKPSLEEVKEAFDVFDDNKDGFIDAKELQRVLCCLGFIDGSEVDNCREMIITVGDGLIDFEQFIKFMENCFY